MGKARKVTAIASRLEAITTSSKDATSSYLLLVVVSSDGLHKIVSNPGVLRSFAGWAITLGDKFSDGTGERGPGQPLGQRVAPRYRCWFR